MEIRLKHIGGDTWEASLPARKNVLYGRPTIRPRRTVHAESEEEAQKLGKEILAREYPAYLAGTSLNLLDLIEYYIDHAERAGVYPQDTAHDYRLVALRYIKPYFNRDADVVTPVDIEKLYGFLVTEAGSDGLGLSPNSIRKLNTVLRATYDFCVREGIVASSPMHEVRLPHYERKRRRSFTERELGKIIAGLEDAIANETDIYRRNALFGAYITLWLGTRVSETCAITRGDISFKRGQVLIDEKVSEKHGMHLEDPKRHSVRTIAPGDTCMDAIKDHIDWQKCYLTEEQRNSDKTPLCTDFSGGFIRPSAMSSIFKMFCKDNGIELADGESFHLIRHTNASQMLGNNVSLTEAQRRLGHARGSTTLDNYGHAIAGEDSAAARVLDEAIEAAKDEGETW